MRQTNLFAFIFCPIGRQVSGDETFTLNDRCWGDCRPAAFIFYPNNSNVRKWVGPDSQVKYKLAFIRKRAYVRALTDAGRWLRGKLHDVFQSRRTGFSHRPHVTNISGRRTR